MGWKDVGWFAPMLELSVGCGAGKLVGLVGFWVIWWVGGMFVGLVECCTSWWDVGWVGGMLVGLVGCWLGWWDVGWARGMCGFVGRILCGLV